jgi:hypothetical protein
VSNTNKANKHGQQVPIQYSSQSQTTTSPIRDSNNARSPRVSTQQASCILGLTKTNKASETFCAHNTIGRSHRKPQARQSPSNPLPRVLGRK